MKNKIAIIGAGNMGGAFFRGLAKHFPIQDLLLCDHNLDKMKALGAKVFSTDANEIIPKADVIILAVKPQSYLDFCQTLSVKMDQKLIISIMARVPLKTLKQKTGSVRIVRSMPNLPAQVQAGVTGWVPTKNLSPVDKKFVEKIFSALGDSVELKTEKALNALTPISGSGPAYFFYLCELLEEKAKKMGFTKDQAKKMAEKTFIGSAKIFQENNLTAAQWRKAVTSKGGTTEAAFTHFQKKNLAKIFDEGIEKGQKRADETI